MNYKTTLYLALGLLVVLGGIYFANTRAPEPAAESETATPAPRYGANMDAGVARNLIEPDAIGEPAKIVCQRAGQEDWVFERDFESDAPGPQWKLTAPFEAPAVGYEVERIPRQILAATYEISHQPGAPGAVTAARAGLDPPAAVITIYDDEDKSVAVEIGRAAGSGDTYVRLPGADTIYVADSMLQSLLKNNALEYRERQLWTFAPKDVTSVEIVERTGAEPMTYRFGRGAGAKWVMEAPAAAPATDKVDEMLRTLSRARVSKWHADGAGELGVYGLDPAALTVRVTAEKKIPPKPKEEPSDEAEEPDAKEEPTIETTVYELHLADRSPIGEDTQVYVRSGDQTLVGTVLKTSADQCRPVMSTWRDMHVTQAPVADVTAIQLDVTAVTATLNKQGSRWKFADSDWYAQAGDVKALLDALKDLEATAFVDGVGGDLDSFGLTEPRAVIGLTLRGQAEPVRIAVGSYTDERVKRLVYVRLNDSTSIAKVRAHDVEPLLKHPDAYRERTVVQVPTARVEQVTITAPNPYLGETWVRTYQKRDNTWHLTAPVEAELEGPRFTELVSTLAALEADEIVAEDAEPAAYGLDQPTASVTLTLKPLKRFQAEPAEKTPAADDEVEPEAVDPDAEEEAAETSDAQAPDSSADGADAQEPAPLKVTEVTGPPETVEVMLSQRDGVLYAYRSDRPVVYRLAPGLLDKLQAQYRDLHLVEFDEGQVTQFTIRQDAETHTFVRTNNAWRYEAEPDLPLDQNKVKNLLLQVGDLKAQAYVAYRVQDLAVFGLADPARQVTIVLEDAPDLGLAVSDMAFPGDSGDGRYAALLGARDVFLLRPEDISRLHVVLDDLEK